MSDSQLNRALNLLRDSDSKGFEDNEVGLEDYVHMTIKANIMSTMGIKYEVGNVYITTVLPTGTKITTFPDYTPDAYEDFCSNILGIDCKQKYNCSVTKNINGVKTRIYAMMPPFCPEPNITISTTKNPPAMLTKQTISDKVWDEIVHSNFMVVGASGSGKTYLTNYLLNKFIRENERIAIIEEFGELIPPNDLCTSILVPPPKPNEKSLLKFVTEQSNLMRLDAIYVGEIKSGEAWPFVVNLASGTRGGCTLHGKTAKDALGRLRALCQLESPASANTIDEFIAKSINYIIVMQNKNIKSIQKLTSVHINGTIQMQEVHS